MIQPRANGFPVLRSMAGAWRRFCGWRAWASSSHVTHALGVPVRVLWPYGMHAVHPDYLTD